MYSPFWNYGVPCLKVFLWELNNYHTTIKFTADWSGQEVTFLDTRVYIKNGRVESDLHVKPTSKHEYLHTKSCHRKHCKTAIPYSQALRNKRICSERENLSLRKYQLKYHLSREDIPINCWMQKSMEQLTHPMVAAPRTPISGIQIAHL